MSSLLMQAAQSAAQADGLAPPTDPTATAGGMSKASASALEQARSAIAAAAAGGTTAASARHVAGGAAPPPPQPPNAGGKKKGPPLRRGKWTPEEEAYANRLIQEFKAGLLPLTDGTTLRTFLSKLLNCDPMRISKKFVGNNCIGKQVFRRRNADLNRLTPEQIQQSRAELSELERRFLERVTQTNRVKSSGVGAGGGAGPAAGGAPSAAALKPKLEASEGGVVDPPSPPWLQPPVGYKHGTGAALAAANMTGANSRAAAAGRALLGGASSNSIKDALAVAQLQQRASQQNLLQNALNSGSASNLLAAARSGSSSGLSSNVLAQLTQSASAARLAGLASNPSMNSLMLKTGLSRDQLSQLARDRGLSSGSLSNMIQRQNSFDALMSLDFQSLQSIDNLANLMQTGGATSQVPETGMKNADFGAALNSSSRQNLASPAVPSSEDLSTAARRLASAGRMESLLKNLSSNNVRGADGGNAGSNANLSNLLQSIQGSGGNISAASLLGAANGQSAVSLANLLRQDSSTGLTALRMQDGLNQRNSSVDDFLSLVAAGDIPHQDPSLLNVPLMQQGGSQNQQQEAAAKLLAQQQMLQASGNSALANALATRSFGNLQQQQNSGSSEQLTQSASATAAATKRKIDELGGDTNGQGSAKR